MQKIRLKLNKKNIERKVDENTTLLEFLRLENCLSVRCGCDTSNCGICTVMFNKKPILSCSKLAISCDGSEIVTLEGLQKEMDEFAPFIANEGGEQCGFCNPGFLINTLCLLKEIKNPTEDDIKNYLSGNLCRCSGYEAHLRGIKKYISYKNTSGKVSKKNVKKK